MSKLFLGDDGEHQAGVSKSYDGPTQHATYTGDYTTKGNATGLIWKTCSQGLTGATCTTGTAKTLVWANANDDPTDGCTALNSENGGDGYAGINSWRLPNIDELITLVDYGSSGPAINTTAFPGTDTNDYWSSTTRATDDLTALKVNFLAGTVGNAIKTSQLYNVRCVSGS